MVKLVFLCRRRPEIGHEDYVRMLLQDHVPLALRHHPTLRRYVVNVVDQAAPGAPALDSIGMLWFDTLADFEARLYDSAAGARVIEADVVRFLGGADAYVTAEDERIAPPRGGEKVFACMMAGAPAPSSAGAVVSVVQRQVDPRSVPYGSFAEWYGSSLAEARYASYRVREHVARW